MQLRAVCQAPFPQSRTHPPSSSFRGIASERNVLFRSPHNLHGDVTVVDRGVTAPTPAGGSRCLGERGRELNAAARY